jgi:hypothetical protein
MSIKVKLFLMALAAVWQVTLICLGISLIVKGNWNYLTIVLIAINIFGFVFNICNVKNVR